MSNRQSLFSINGKSGGGVGDEEETKNKHLHNSKRIIQQQQQFLSFFLSLLRVVAYTITAAI